MILVLEALSQKNVQNSWKKIYMTFIFYCGTVVKEDSYIKHIFGDALV